MPPLLTAITSSSRQLLLLLRCISFAKKAQIRISPSGIRISTEEGSTMEAFVFLEAALFTTYTYIPSSPADTPPVFEISLPALLEILNIFSLSDPTFKRPGGDSSHDSYTAHRLNRHANIINAFSNHALGITGTCTLTYAGEGHPLSIHMREKDVTTTCDLTTYATSSTEEIPFARDDLSLKTILRSAVLLDTITELSSLNPSDLVLRASPSRSSNNNSVSLPPNLTFSASGALGSATIDFTTTTSPSSENPMLETFHCPHPTSASFRFACVKAAQRAMQAATKVSLRLDREGVLSLQFLVEMGTGEAGEGSGEAVAFVDFRVVPLVDGEEEGDGEGDGEDSD